MSDEQNPGTDTLDNGRAAFTGGVLDALRILVGRLANGAPMDPESLRDAFAVLVPEGAPTIVSLPARQLVEDLEKIIEVRDGARFHKTVEIWRAAGRIASDIGTA